MRRFSKGFSLVELMIVVAIIGILAAIAIPNFVTMQLKAKRAELPSNVDAIKKSEMSYDAAFDGYITATVQPRATSALDKDQFVWATTYTDWNSLGWAPDGAVRGNYEVTLTTGTGETFTVTGISDVDNDDSYASYTATPTVNATLVAASANYY